MSRVKKLKTKMKMDDDMLTMFNQMLDGRGDPKIALSKYENLITLVKDLNTILGIFNNVLGSHDDIVDFVARTEKSINITTANVTSTEFDIPELNHYHYLKNCNVIKSWLKSLKPIMEYKHNIETWNDSNICFLDQNTVGSWDPFTFSKMDLCEILRNTPDENKPSIRRLIMLTLGKIITKALEIYKIVTSPDIDVKEFAKHISTTLESVKKRPELSRCQKAFKKISDSLEMFESNFGEYYMDFMQSQNSSIILENFVLDVSKSLPPDPELTRQFRTIIKWLRDMTATAAQHGYKVPKKIINVLNKIPSEEPTSSC